MAENTLQKQRQEQATIQTTQTAYETAQKVEYKPQGEAPETVISEESQESIAKKVKIKMDVKNMKKSITDQYPPEKIIGSARQEQTPPADDDLAGSGVLDAISMVAKSKIPSEV